MMKFITRRKLDTGDTEQDFLVLVGDEIPMIYAYKKNTSDWVYHSKRGVWSLQLSAEGGLGDAGLDERELLRNFEYEAHGWWLWSSWFIFGLALLITKRYTKKHWTVMHYLHAFLGYFVMVVTIIYTLKVTDWEPTKSTHHVLGTTCLFLTIIGTISGSVTAGTMKAYNGDKAWSAKERVEKVAKFHRIIGYVMLFIGNMAAASGIGYYFGNVMNGDSL